MHSLNKPLHRKIAAAAIGLSVLAGLVFRCGVNNSAGYDTWTFSGYVINGYTEKPLSGATIYYRNQDGTEQQASTSSIGGFAIGGLPYGERSFRFVYPVGKDSVHFTERVVIASCWQSASSGVEGMLGDVSKIVKLFPLTAGMEGKLIVKLQASGLTIPAASALIKVSFSDSALENATPSVFETETDSEGFFSFNGLPVAPGLSFQVPNVIINKRAYTLTPVIAPQLFSDQIVSVGSLYMHSADSTDWPANLVSSNVLSSDGFGRTGVPVDIQAFYVLSTPPDSSTIEATFTGGGSPEAFVAVRGDTVFVTPARNLTYDSLITVTVTGKDIQGNRIFLKFDSTQQFRTERGVFAVASNTWDVSGSKASGFGLLDTMWVKFSENLDTNVSKIQWMPSAADTDLWGTGSKTNASVWIREDSLFVKPGLATGVDYGKTIGFKVSVAGRSGKRSNPIDFVVDLASDRYTLIASNVLSDDGFGLTGMPVDITPFYVLATTPDASTIEASISGGGDPQATVSVHGDTVLIDPVKNLKYNELITVTITGKFMNGEKILLTFDGLKRFKTEQGIFPVASNTWDAAGDPVIDFDLYGAMWVKYSDILDTTTSKIKWTASDADYDIYGSGAVTNAVVWIHADTLFVKPDPRLAVDFGKTMGFNAAVTSQSGKLSAAIDFKVTLVESSYFVKWTNTKDQLGNRRSDFGIMDPVVVVSSVPIAEITGISGAEGALSPPDMTLDNIKLSGDTITYRPQLRLKPNTVYGMDFNVTFANGLRRNDVLEVTWQTSTGVRVLSTNNRQGGSFRAMSAFGDSLTVTFSKPIDTGALAPVRFKVNMATAAGIPVRTNIAWDAARTTATIHPLDTLPVADFDASPAYTSDAKNTRAVDSLTFDLTTLDGEQVYKLGPENERIEIHTEKGLCATSANFLPGHDPLMEISASETPVNGLPVDAALQIGFNRAIDTVIMGRIDASLYAGIEEKESGLKVPSAISFSANCLTLTIKPNTPLKMGQEYYIWLKGIPGQFIAAAPAINKHAGSFTGKATNSRLLTKAIKTVSPDIRQLTATLAPDSNSIGGVEGNRLGISSGFNYSGVVGTANVITDASIKFRIGEAAWNLAHGDSVEGYQVQVQKIDRRGNATDWYDLSSTIATNSWSPFSQANNLRSANINLVSASFYNSFLTVDGDGSGSFYSNGLNLFNDSSQIRIRVRPFFGSGDPLNNEVGAWSSPLAVADNVAPCDSDFVTAGNCNTLSIGGVQVTEHISFNNAAGSDVNDTGYIEITFPEDMDPNGPAPAIDFFYGFFGVIAAHDSVPADTINPPAPLSAAPESGTKSRWLSARKYRMHISVPVFDYTFGRTDSGAFYNINVAGCRDVSGNAIQAYGSNGSLASSDITRDTRPRRTQASAEQKQGTLSVIAGFARCD